MARFDMITEVNVICLRAQQFPVLCLQIGLVVHSFQIRIIWTKRNKLNILC